ncbi:MAG: ferredoxin [Deltaproteobacteria bacterium]|nr:MAG: ferredoxin [Deltaproteobacteria bacterium]
MSFVITDACEGCGTCLEVCPVDAISEGGGAYSIDAETCVDCGTCAEECPLDACEQA